MRLRCLDLTRYGKFTDHKMDFGERIAGQPDLHIVYGPNEAGKSTALAGFLDLLFGIETQSRFNFLHPYSSMRVGATLEIAGKAQKLCRIKRKQNSLLDGDDQTVAEHIISAHLGGIDRDSYRAMFSLDDDTLEAGGESILASKGDLGELLFAASAGLANLSQKLAGLREEADGFYKPHARSTELAGYKARMAKLKEEREAIDTAAGEYARRIETRDLTGAQYEDALAERSKIQSRMDQLRRSVSALPRLATLRALRVQIEPLAALPEAPAGWLEAHPTLQKEETELAVQLNNADREIADLTAELTGIIVDDAALQLADTIEGWGDLRARAITAKDIPERQLEVRTEDLAIAGLLGRLGQAGHANPRDLMIDAPSSGALRDLLERRSGIEAAVTTAMHEHAEAQRLRAEAADALGQANPVQDAHDANHLRETHMAAIDPALAALNSGDHISRRRMAQRDLKTYLAEAHDRLMALRPWDGDIDQLANLTVPGSDELRAWKDALADAQKQHSVYESDITRLGADRLRLDAEIGSISTGTGVLTDQQAGDIRAARELAWANHRRTLDQASADTFEASLRRDDIVTNARLRHETEIARLHQASQALAIVKADEDIARQGRASARFALEKIQAAIAAAIAAMTQALPTTTTPAQLEVWLDRRSEALTTRTALQQARRDLEEAETEANAARQRLSGALSAVGVAHDPDADAETLIALSQTALRREAESKALRKTLRERERAVKARERALEKALEAEQAWQSSWSSLCAKTWLRDFAAPDQVSTVREILAVLPNLGAALDRRAGLLDRIDKMQQDQRAFAAAVAAAARQLGMADDGIAPLDLDRRITALVHAAQISRDRRAARAKDLQDARKVQRAIKDKIEIHGTRRAEMTNFLAVDSLAEVGARLRDIERRSELRKQAENAERDIMDALRVSTITEAETLLDHTDRAALDAELADLEARFNDYDRRARELFSEHSKAEDKIAAIGGDSAVAKIEEQRKTILLQIEDSARRYISLRAGIAAAEHALRSYRQQHRSSMMANASEAFRTISRDAYTGLASQPQQDKEVLVAIASDGGSKIASQLSKGTRFQLYLALRVAGYHEFATQRDPVPFIADDIMETFDDFRAEETLRLFAEMGQVGQVIYMTHHRHLCDIAQKTCPNVRLHSLLS